MTQSLFIGVDGGATKCIVRVENEKGELLGREVSGPANIRLSVTQAFESIQQGLSRILQSIGIESKDPSYQLHAGIGVAGCELQSAYQSFLGMLHGFETVKVTSDAHIACLGAHQGEDGSIIIIGTGVAGFQMHSGHMTKVSGWGFPHDDEGGGAYLGLQAVKITLQFIDRRLSSSELANQVLARFENNREHFINWANQANSTAFAELAPAVIQQAATGEPFAQAIMREAAAAVNRVAVALQSAQVDHDKILPCSLIGGVAGFIEPWLNDALRSRLSPCKLSPDAGAILFIRDHLAQKNISISDHLARVNV